MYERKKNQKSFASTGASMRGSIQKEQRNQRREASHLQGNDDFWNKIKMLGAIASMFVSGPIGAAAVAGLSSAGAEQMKKKGRDNYLKNTKGNWFQGIHEDASLKSDQDYKSGLFNAATSAVFSYGFNKMNNGGLKLSDVFGKGKDVAGAAGDAAVASKTASTAVESRLQTGMQNLKANTLYNIKGQTKPVFDIDPEMILEWENPF